jgi:hypothetical protein
MTLRDQIITLALAYAKARGLSVSRTSTLCFGDGRLVTALQGGADLTTRRYERAMIWFSTHWPEGAAWPEGVPRPAPTAALGADQDGEAA